MQKFPQKIFDGNALAKRVKQELKAHIDREALIRNSRPMLGHIIVGNLTQSRLYVQHKLKACDEIGILHRGFTLKADADES